MELNPLLREFYREGVLDMVGLQDPERWSVVARAPLADVQDFIETIFLRPEIKALRLMGSKVEFDLLGSNFEVKMNLPVSAFHHEDWNFPRSPSIRERIPSKEKFCYCTLEELFERLGLIP